MGVVGCHVDLSVVYPREPDWLTSIPESHRFSQNLVSRPGKMSIKSGDGLNSDQNKKARFICLERQVKLHKGLEIAKAGLVALARIFNVPCKSTGKSALGKFYATLMRSQ